MRVTIKIPMTVGGQALDPAEIDIEVGKDGDWKMTSLTVDGREYVNSEMKFDMLRLLGGHHNAAVALQRIIEKYLDQAIADHKEAIEERRGEQDGAA